MNKNKKEYKKPQLNIVELATEEVLAAGCKFLGYGGNGPSGSACGFPGGACNGEGS